MLARSYLRFTGSLAQHRDQGAEKQWSLILKVVGSTAAQDDPNDVRYWKREVLAYQSGHLADLAGSLTAPRFFGTYEFSEKAVGLWLEDVIDTIGRWPLQHYRLVARHLGQFNGAYVGENALTTLALVKPGMVTEKSCQF